MDVIGRPLDDYRVSYLVADSIEVGIDSFYTPREGGVYISDTQVSPVYNDKDAGVYITLSNGQQAKVTVELL